MASMVIKTTSLLGLLLLVILASEAAVVNRDGSGEGELPSDIPDLPGEDKNLRKVPPFGEPSLGEKEFNDFGVNNPDDYPLDYDFDIPVGNDYNGEEFLNPGKKPEKKPDVDRDDRPPKKNGGEEGDRDDEEDKTNEIPKNDDEADKDYKIPKNPDEEEKEIPKKHDEEEGEIPKKHDEEEEEIPKKHDEEEEEIPKKHDEEEEEIPKKHDDEDEKTEEPFDAEEDFDKSLGTDEDDDESEEVPEEAGEPGETGPFHGGSIFDTPFFNVRQVSKYFQQLEKALGLVFRQTMEEATLLNGTYANTTEEEVDIDGKKYIVEKSIIKGKNNDSSIYVEAISSKMEPNDTKKDSGL